MVPLVSELKVCQLTDWFRGINQGLVLQRALSALHVGGRSMQAKLCSEPRPEKQDLDLSQVTSEAELFTTVAFVVVIVEFGVGINNPSTFK